MRNLFTFFLILVFLTPTFKLKAEKFSIGWEIWYPFQYRSADESTVGLDFEILYEILSKTNDSAEYIELPWLRHVNYIRSGEIDIAMGSSKTKERAEYSYFTEPYRKEKIALVVRKNQSKKINLPTLQSLSSSNYLIGIELGYYYGPLFKELIANQKFYDRIVEVVDLEQNVNMLIKNRIDGLLADEVTINAFVEKYGLKGELEIHPLEIYESDIHLMLSKVSMTPEQLKRINQAINKLKSTGRLDEILKKYSLN